MSIIQVTRLSGGDPERMAALAKRAKAIWVKNGAEDARCMRMFTGPWLGQWLFFVRCTDWAAYGKAQENVQKDPEFQRMIAETLSMAKMEARNTAVGYDI